MQLPIFFFHDSLFASVKFKFRMQSSYPDLKVKATILTIDNATDSLTNNPEIGPYHQQKYLGSKGLIALIAFLSAFPPLSTDIYLPSLPNMAEYFGVSVNLANLTLILFFVFFSIGALLWGP